MIFTDYWLQAEQLLLLMGGVTMKSDEFGRRAARLPGAVQDRLYALISIQRLNLPRQSSGTERGDDHERAAQETEDKNPAET